MSFVQGGGPVLGGGDAGGTATGGRGVSSGRTVSSVVVRPAGSAPPSTPAVALVDPASADPGLVGAAPELLGAVPLGAAPLDTGPVGTAPLGAGTAEPAAASSPTGTPGEEVPAGGPATALTERARAALVTALVVASSEVAGSRLAETTAASDQPLARKKRTTAASAYPRRRQ
jgi:hypothetical protein